jgi:hypothetical protein
MHLSHMFKKIGKIGESVFGLARQKNPGSSADTSSAPAATEQPTLHDASTNAGEGQVNFQSMKMPTQQAVKANQTPQGTPMGQLGG